MSVRARPTTRQAEPKPMALKEWLCTEVAEGGFCIGYHCNDCIFSQDNEHPLSQGDVDWAVDLIVSNIKEE